MTQQIDPSQAVADLDALTLNTWEFGGAVDRDNVSLELGFVGGLGRVTNPDGTSRIVDPIGNLKLTGALPGLSEEEHQAMGDLLDRWQETRTFLRVLEFPSYVLVVEDGSNFLQLPQN